MRSKWGREATMSRDFEKENSREHSFTSTPKLERSEDRTPH
jgi:hypothetical protein